MLLAAVVHQTTVRTTAGAGGGADHGHHCGGGPAGSQEGAQLTIFILNTISILLQYNVSSAQIEAAVRAAVLRQGHGRGPGEGGVPSLRVLVGLLGAAMLLAAILTLIYKVAMHRY